MLYLFGSSSYENGTKILKIGYSKEVKKRENMYLLHNPLGKFLSWREGTEKEELKLHLRLGEYKTNFLEEWFIDNDEVISVFSMPWDEIDAWLWEHRSEIFSYPLPKNGTLKRQILNDLLKKFKGYMEGEKLL